ncbi:aminotransferase class IV [Ekhidna sp.]|uniref:aminotransferase class IV n=1 Tax=Ekhidna sp. TaxID=2608089 RepID=UPI003B5080B9
MAYCYFKGGVIDESDASLSIHSIGANRGFGVFDFFRMRNGKYCFLEEHLERFARSQKFMELSEIIEKDEIKEALEMLRDWNGFNDAGFKLVLLGDGSESDPALDPLFFITQTNLKNHQVPPFSSIILHEYLREYPQIKSTNYFTSNLLHRKRIAAGSIDVVYHHEGIISEASRSNIFIVKEGVVQTPKRNILEGVTRMNVLKIAENIVAIEQTDITVEELKSADEIFLTSTLKEVLPIVEVDGQKVGNGSVGRITRQLRAAFEDLLHS